MSGLAVIIQFNGTDVPPGAIEAMTSAMDYRGPDGIAHLRRGPIALGHCMLHTTAESLEEVQPLANEDQSLLLVFDGWLSNWQELRSDLLSLGARLRDRSDAELVLRAYEAWGDDCPRRIDGEFALAIWDSRTRELFCARDHIGQKSLHWHSDGNRLIVATDLAAILAVPGVPKQLNRGMLAEVLANEWYSLDETVWQGIQRLPAAHWMRVSAGGQHQCQYWAPPLEVGIRYACEEDYCDHYRELFADCVRRTARTHLPLACDVSGGLDSSPIFAMADRQLRDGTAIAPDLKGYTYKFEPGGHAYELDFARSVALHTARPVQEILPFLPELDWFTRQVHRDCDLPNYPNGVMAVNIGKALRADGCRVLLNGEGGDDWMAGKPFYFAEHIAERDVRGLCRSVIEDAGDIGWRETAFNVMRYGLAPSLPRWAKSIANRSRQRADANWIEHFTWLSPELRALLAERRAQSDQGRFAKIANPARRSQFMGLADPFNHLVRGATSRQAAHLGYEVRTPMYARKFMEFAFAIPERIRTRGSNSKYLHSRALAGLLPEDVAKRRTKAEFSVALDLHLLGREQDFANSIPDEMPDFLDKDGINSLYRKYVECDYANKPRWELWGAIIVRSLGLS